MLPQRPGAFDACSPYRKQSLRVLPSPKVQGEWVCLNRGEPSKDLKMVGFLLASLSTQAFPKVCRGGTPTALDPPGTLLLNPKRCPKPPQTSSSGQRPHTVDGRNPAPLGNHWKLWLVGIYRGINIPGFLRWCEMDFVRPQ